jgi:DNA-binding CsgD family transcriptional regulator
VPDDELRHYGTPRHSGRYPWGSGDDPYQRNASFLGQVDKLRKQGLKEVDIAKGMGMNTSELRKAIALAGTQKRAYEAAEAFRLKAKGCSNSEIARRMQKNESSVRLLLSPALNIRNDETARNAKILRDAVNEHNYIDVGAGTEQLMGITSTRLSNAVALLQRDGYRVYNNIPVEQLGTGHETLVKVLTKPDISWGEVAKNKDKIKLVNQGYSEDGGRTSRLLEPPKSIDSKRIAIRYGDEGGADKDGVIELRRGVPDISLGNARYAQVRIAVDDTHYIKGMAKYGDDMPDGVDIVFNTNKKDTGNKLDALKPIKVEDPDNPFGATIKSDDKLIRAQRHYIDKDGKEQQSVLNIVNEEGEWSRWSKNLASQMLSKQNPSLAKRQLDLSYGIAKDELDEIRTLTNPTVRASLLDKFASQCDSDATHLQAAALPRQTTKVLLPFPDMKESEVYAPSYNDGEHVALVRFPHGGTFEIPTLTVNNKSKSPRESIGNAIDAIGIHPKVAERLSGADFDGDSVVVIPIDKVKITTRQPLKGLKGFDPKAAYPGYEGMHVMDSREKGLEMGKVSNLITDMTIKGANEDEICRAVRHSMVVIDAEKHKLNYKQSEIDHNIAELKTKYQGGPESGAATLLSRSTSEIRVPQRKIKAPSKMTPEEQEAYREGKMVYEDTGKTFMKGKKLKSGEIRYKEKPRLDKVELMTTKEDAFDLVSGSRENTTRIESVYANYANSMKALANTARKEARVEQDIPYSHSAFVTYAPERASLKAKLNIALKNAPLERQAQLIANKKVATKKYNNPNMDNEHLKRLKGQELDAARKLVGAGKTSIRIEDKEWEAITAGAVSKTFLKDILKNADPKRVRELATPRTHKGVAPGKVARAKSMLANGYTQAEVADALGVSVSTLVNAIGVGNY